MKYMKESIAELLGTFTLVFIGGYAVVVADTVLIPALAHGLILVAIVFAYGHISGAHVNPAVTLGLLVGNKISVEKAAYYWIAQFVGGILAGLLIVIIAPDTGGSFNYGATTGSLTDNHVWRAALMELVLTFFLVTSVYQAAVYGKAGDLAGVAIGFTLGACLLAGGVLTGASLNPARTVGPAVFAGEFDYVIPYLIGIFAGGALAGYINTMVLGPAEE